MRLFIILLALSINGIIHAQDFNGQWKGSFNARGEDGRVEYVLEINVDGNKVTGYSYTYPFFSGKKYYDICEIKGTVNTKEKYIEVTEVGKIKSNVPPPYRFDCFQTHKLSYSKNSDLEKLSGPWEPAKLSVTLCGYGTTTLERRRLKDIIATLKDEKTETVKTTAPKKTEEKTKPKTNTAVSSNKPKPATPPVVSKPKTDKKDTKDIVKEKPKLSLIKDSAVIVKKKEEPRFEKIKTKPLPRFETRTNKVLETIEVEEEDIAVQLYDNGEIDGDTVTVTFNGEVIAYKKGLSTKPIILNLKVKADVDNELVMYAENLGSIPPNTALMVVWVDDKRYTVTISSDEKRNGSIIFRRQN